MPARISGCGIQAAHERIRAAPWLWANEQRGSRRICCAAVRQQPVATLRTVGMERRRAYRIGKTFQQCTWRCAVARIMVRSAWHGAQLELSEARGLW